MRLVLNADDFGGSARINSAVELAHARGVLDSASLMVAGDAAAQAVEIARRMPSLSVGLHLVVSDGPGVLVGCLPNRPLRLGLRYAFSKEARRSLAAELTAQFEHFAAAGLELAHVDGHQHMHMHPVVFDLMLPLAEKFGAGRIRIVRDDLQLALRHDRHRRAGKTLLALVFAALARRCRRRCIGTTLNTLDRTYGLFQSGMMEETYVLRVLGELNTSAEIYFHPIEGERLDALGPNPIDLQTLLSPQVQKAVVEHRHHEMRHVTTRVPADDGKQARSWTHA